MDYTEPLEQLIDDEKKEGQILLKRFKLIKKLGEGGMGQVWEAEDSLLDTNVALKFFSKINLSSKKLQRIKREVLKGRELSHNNLLKYYEVFDEEKYFVVSMELIKGRTLSEEIGLRKFNEEEIKNFLSQILDVLNYIHSQGILHRDIKPSNIFLKNDGSFILGDLGILYLDEEESLTGTKEIIGTLHYIPPEAFDKKFMPQYDYYSLGVTLYEMISSKLPFDGTEAEIIKGHQLKEPPGIKNNVSKKLKKLIYGLLIKKPEKRWMSKEIKNYIFKRTLPLLPKERKKIFYYFSFLIIFIFSYFLYKKLFLERYLEPTNVKIENNKVLCLSNNKLLWEKNVSFEPSSSNILDIDSDGKKEVLIYGIHKLNLKKGFSNFPIFNSNGEEYNLQSISLSQLEDSFFDYPKTYFLNFSLIDLLSKGKKDLLIEFINSPFYPSYILLWSPIIRDYYFTLITPGRLTDVKKFKDGIAWSSMNHKFLHLMTLGISYPLKKSESIFLNLSDRVIGTESIKAFQILETYNNTNIDFSSQDEIFVTLSDGIKRKVLEDGTIEGQEKDAGKKSLELLNEVVQCVRFLLGNETSKAEEIIEKGISESKNYKLTGYIVLFNYLKAELYLRKGNTEKAVSHCFKIYNEYPNYSVELPIIAGFYSYLNKDFKNAKEIWKSLKDTLKIASGKYMEIYTYITFASMLLEKDEGKLIREIEKYKNIGAIETWKNFLNYQTGWIKLLNNKPESAKSILKDAIKEDGMEPNVAGYFLSKIILNEFDKNEFDNYVNGKGAEPYYIQWIGAVGKNEIEKAKLIWETFKNYSMHSQDSALLLPPVERVIKTYPEAFSKFI